MTPDVADCVGALLSDLTRNRIASASRASALAGVRALLWNVGEDPDREGLLDTPERVVKAWAEMTAGYAQRPADVLKAFEDGACDQMVVVKDIPFVSSCEHHMLPFTGVAHVGYLPDGRIVGLSKLPRLLDVFARRLQVQERLTSQVVAALMAHLKPKGAGCVISAEHHCMACRGVKRSGVTTVTSALGGLFLTDPAVKAEFLTLIKL